MLFYICDDSPLDQEMIKHYLTKYANANGLSCEIMVFPSASELIDSYQSQKLLPDLLFLDIYMTGLSGIDAAKKLRVTGFTSDIIFITSSTEYAMESYDVNALYYLKKPFKYEDFCKALSRFSLKEEKEESYSIPRKGSNLSILHKDILFLETGRHSVILHAVNDTISFSGSLTECAKELLESPQFLGCGQSYLINMNHVKNIENASLTMSDNSVIQIPVRRKKEIVSVIRQWQLNNPR